jgi:hypothetical protein
MTMKVAVLLQVKVYPKQHQQLLATFDSAALQ